MTERGNTRGWAKLHSGFERTIAKVIDEHGVAAVGYWAMMLVEARRGEEVEFGYIDTTARSFARLVGDTKSRPSLWQSFIEHGLLTLTRGDVRRGFTVRMHAEYFDEQSPRGASSAERMRNLRARQRAQNTALQRDAVTDRASHSDASVTASDVTVTGRDEDNRQERREVVPNGTSPKPKRISAATPEQIDQNVLECRETLNGLHPLVEQMIDLAARENKTGTISAGRALREFWLKAVGMNEEFDRGALRHGLEEAVSRGIPNMGYVKKVAKNWKPNNRPTARGGDIIDIEANDGQKRPGQYAKADFTW